MRTRRAGILRMPLRVVVFGKTADLLPAAALLAAMLSAGAMLLPAEAVAHACGPHGQ